ncbi:50S ribosomal protein L6 [Buchnera aphidicola (Mindarus keteleerifoliae)]|uniref:50S ribosomal protein L6 n=1 Tax=Buchnera aphidicola TaxID=9 RepID=UPI0031B733CC
MSRVAKRPILIPEGVKISFDKKKFLVKGKLGILIYDINDNVQINYKNNKISFKIKKKCNANDSWVQAGTARSLINSMIIGVSQGYEKKLQLIGVGYRVSLVQNNIIKMFLGYSHPIEYSAPDEVQVIVPSQTEILLKSSNKQLIGQVAANIRSFRPPEPYKGKGIRYADEIVRIKEAKKK